MSGQVVEAVEDCFVIFWKPRSIKRNLNDQIKAHSIQYGTTCVEEEGIAPRELALVHASTSNRI